MRPRWSGLVLGLLLTAGNLGQVQALAQDAEAQITAAFLFNFCKFVEWPESPGDRFDVAVLGSEKRAGDFGSISGKKVRDAKLQVAAADDTLVADEFEVVFIPADRADHIESILGSIGDRPVLTVSDSEGFCESGGMIEMKSIKGKMRFSVNTAAADRAGLTISSQLLKMARRIIKED